MNSKWTISPGRTLQFEGTSALCIARCHDANFVYCVSPVQADEIVKMIADYLNNNCVTPDVKK